MATVGQIIAEMQYGSSAKTNADPSGVPVLRVGTPEGWETGLQLLEVSATGPF
jgi:hypothetical protein